MAYDAVEMVKVRSLDMTKKIVGTKAKIKLISLSPYPKGALALVGAWKELSDAEMDKFVADVYAAREKDSPRKLQ